ncbi:MAG: DUF2971 domain-containing protein [Ignavibacteria bacterium]|jgi:hypothetical protein
MFSEHPAFVDPKNDDLKLWRYIDRQKLFHLLESSCLYFCRADYFQKEDHFEGSYPRLEYEHQVKKDDGKDISRNLYNIISKDTFISCWHLSEHENIAMWKLYAKDERGISIQTDIKNFKDAFKESDRNIFAGKVDYIDYETDAFYQESSHNYFAMNAFSLFIHKRKIYSYENEYRGICTDPNGSKYNGINIKVDLNKIINKIYLSPYASEEEFFQIKTKLQELETEIPICYSSFKAQPYY